MSEKAIKIGVLADTHICRLKEMPVFLLNQLREMDCIIHLGDCETFEFLDELNSLGNIIGVAGNHDNSAIQDVFANRVILEVKGKRIGLIHGHGCFLPFGLKRGLYSKFSRDDVDAILYGHTHVASKYVHDGIMYFNPGSTAGRFPARRPSYGIITIEKTITAEIFYLDPVSSSITHSVSPLSRASQRNSKLEGIVKPASRCMREVSRFFVNGAALI